MADESTTTTTTTDNSTQQPTATTGAQTAKPEPKFTQEDMDAVQGNTRKQAAAAERARILKELGIENVDDPDAVKTAKSKLADAKKAEDEKKTTEQRLQDQIDALTKERDDEKQRSAQIAAERIADKVDNKLRTLAKGVNEKVATPDDVVDWLRLKKRAEVDKLANDDGTIDEKAAEKLVADFKKEKASWFAVNGGVGSPSVSGGRSLEPDTADKKRAQALSQRTIRG